MAVARSGLHVGVNVHERGMDGAANERQHRGVPAADVLAFIEEAISYAERDEAVIALDEYANGNEIPVIIMKRTDMTIPDGLTYRHGSLLGLYSVDGERHMNLTRGCLVVVVAAILSSCAGNPTFVTECDKRAAGSGKVTCTEALRMGVPACGGESHQTCQWLVESRGNMAKPSLGR